MLVRVHTCGAGVSPAVAGASRPRQNSRAEPVLSGAKECPLHSGRDARTTMRPQGPLPQRGIVLPFMAVRSHDSGVTSFGLYDTVQRSTPNITSWVRPDPVDALGRHIYGAQLQGPVRTRNPCPRHHFGGGRRPHLWRLRRWIAGDLPWHGEDV